MKLFIDTANVDEIKEINDWGVICGVTTNPSLIAKEGRDFKEVIKEITSIVDGPISAEVISLESDKMVEEALELSKIHENVIIKVPMTSEGLKAFSGNQALLAARAGATFVSPFIGRMDDIGNVGMNIIEDIITVFEIHGIDTEVISASIRNPMHVLESAKTGAHIATIPYQVFKVMLKHPLTDIGIEKFLKDWESVK